MAATPDDPAGAVMMALPQGLIAALSGETPIIEDDAVAFHEGSQILLPKNITYQRAKKILKQKMEEEETVAEFSREYHFRPMDGAYATMQVLKEVFGVTRQAAIMTMFGPEPPEMKTINISPTETAQVPWGRIVIPHLDDASFYTTAKRHRDYGAVFVARCEAKRKHKVEVDKMFDAIEQFLKTKSIYKGKALVDAEEPTFLDLANFDPEKVFYSDNVRQQLDASVWSAIKYTKAFQREKLPLKKAVLLYGPYGTGKTLAGQLTADIATKNEWTFIAAKPGQEDLAEAMKTARLYSPAVVFFEDIDEQAGSGEHDEMARIMEAFDGITAKGGQALIAVMTTNHVERIHKAMLRPGRLDALIPVEDLDRSGVERLVRVLIPEDQLDPAVDFDEVYASMEDFYPAFIAEPCSRARTVGLGRAEGGKNYRLETSDLVVAAQGLKPQLAQMNEAQEGRKRPTTDIAIEQTVKRVIDRTGVQIPGFEPGELQSGEVPLGPPEMVGAKIGGNGADGS